MKIRSAPALARRRGSNILAFIRQLLSACRSSRRITATLEQQWRADMISMRKCGCHAIASIPLVWSSNFAMGAWICSGLFSITILPRKPSQLYAALAYHDRLRTNSGRAGPARITSLTLNYRLRRAAQKQRLPPVKWRKVVSLRGRPLCDTLHVNSSAEQWKVSAAQNVPTVFLATPPRDSPTPVRRLR